MSSRRYRSRRWLAARAHCHDCGIDIVAVGHWCMVEDAVWAATGLGKEDGVLCLQCIETRLRRALVYEDFRPTDKGNRDFWRGHDRMLPRAWPQHIARSQTAF
jgi:hypothetical protein